MAELERIIYKSGIDSAGHGRIHGVHDHVPRNNYEATSSPTANNDISEGYGPGSEWVDVAADTEYKCLDGTLGVAVWTVAVGIATDHARLHPVTDVLDHSGTADRILYVDGNGEIQELAYGADGTVLTSTGASTDPAFEVASGGGIFSPTYVVDGDASDDTGQTINLSTGGTTILYQTVQSALTAGAALPGGTDVHIYVTPGTYNEDITVPSGFIGGEFL